MKNLVIAFLSVFFLSALAFAQDDNSSSAIELTAEELELEDFELEESPNLNKGNVQVGGSLGASHSSFATTISLNPSVEYFVVDRLSMGGTIQLSSSEFSSTVGGGPSFTFYFAKGQKWASYLGAGALYISEEDRRQGYFPYQYWSGSGKLGVNYFFAPSVAFGPTLRYNHSFDDRIRFEELRGFSTLLFQFSVYL